MVRGQKSLPSGVGGAVLTNAGGQFLAYLRQAGIEFSLRGFRSLQVLLPYLLLDEGAADQLFERLFGSENTEAGLGRVKNRQANLLVHVAGQDGLVVDHGHHAVKHNGLGWRRLLGQNGSESCQGEAQGNGRGRATQAGVRDAEAKMGPVGHQKVCPRLKKKLKWFAWPT
jgi:hypothetical protein